MTRREDVGKGRKW